MYNYFITGYKKINYTNDEGRNVNAIIVYAMSDLFCDYKGLAFTEFFIDSKNDLFNVIQKLDFSNNIYKCNLHFSFNNQKLKLKGISDITELPLIV